MKKTEEKKVAILAYLTDVPVYRWAAKSVGISEDTLQNWRKEDAGFSAQCEANIAEFVKRTSRRAKPEFQLERLLPKDFRQQVDITSGDKPIQAPILGGITKDDLQPNNSDPETEQT